MSNHHAKALFEVLPVLRNLHSFVSGVYEGDTRALQLETRLVLIRVEEIVRETMVNDVLSPEDRINYEAAMDKIVAINTGRLPFDESMLQHAQDYCTASLSEHVKRKLKKGDDPEARPKRQSKH